jgi:hypothetical protein
MSDLAPIVLFVYNRPEHTRRTLAALAADPLSVHSDLIIYADAAKKPEHADSVQATRAVAREASGFKSVSIEERVENLGLARSVIAGVTAACQSRGRAIVLEDDLVMVPGFLSYMNNALDRYANETKVMQISGYMFPISHPEELPETFFSVLPTSWGWSTWQRAWSLFEPDANSLLERLKSHDVVSFDMDGQYSYSQMLMDQSRGVLDVWGVRWYASMFLQGGLCLYPSRSLVSNIGMDGSGEHCGRSDAFDVALTEKTPTEFPTEVRVSRAGEQKIRDFFKHQRGSELKRFSFRVKRHLLKVFSRRGSRANH